MTVHEALTSAITRFDKAGSDSPEADARMMLGHLLNLNPNQLFLKKRDTLSPRQSKAWEKLVRRREKLEPVALILGYKDFYRDRFLVSRHTLIPRPDTEHLLYAAEELKIPVCRALDIGTGTGAIAFSLARIFPEAQIQALDIDLRTARKNALLFHLPQVRLISGNFLHWKSSPRLKKTLSGPYDLILSNPPYLAPEDFSLLDPASARFEDRKAFYGGKDGMDFYRAIAFFSKERLNPGGAVIVETDHKFKKVMEIFQTAGFTSCEVRKDYGGRERVLIALNKNS